MLFLLACGGTLFDGADVDRPGIDGGGGSDGERSVATVDVGCGLVSDLSSPNFLEGDTVRFNLRCSGEMATADALVSAVALPEAATFDTETLSFAWEAGPADGGRIDLVFSVLPRDGSARMPALDTVTVWVADDPSQPDNVTVDPAAYTEEWGLPVVHVVTEGVLSTEVAAPASITWYGNTYEAEIQIHGKTSTRYPKVSYALKFTGAELPVDVWGVTRDHLLLVTTFDDNSYVRQKFVFDLWSAIAEYWGERRLTPRTFFSVVYLNGSYLGLYLGEDRVDDEFLDHMGFDRDANLYKAVTFDANFALTDDDGEPKALLHAGYDKMEGYPEKDYADLDALVDFTGRSTSAELVAASGDRIDLDEFVDATLLLLYTNAEDSYTKNAYLCHAPGTGLFHYVPWDFNASWGQNWRTYRVGAEFADQDVWENRVFWAIHDDPEGNALLRARFEELRSLGPLALSWQIATLDGYFEQIDPSAQRDWETWGARYRTYESWADHRDEVADWTDYDGEREYLYEWVADRAAYFDLSAW